MEERWSSAANSTQPTGFIKSLMAPSLATAEGGLLPLGQKKTPPSEPPEGGVMKVIAGGGLEPST